ncbi:hypothetical protein CL638_02420 [bacterium]|nr:hypothetical protein [bacterium]
MKKITITALFVLMGTFGATQPANALSCLDPDGMINMFVDESEYLIVTATPTKQAEYVKSGPDTTDPNMMYPEGYTAQLLNITESYKGSTPDQSWVYFSRNGTWNYLCVGEPPAIDSDNVYVLHKDEGLFSFTKVVALYAADSDMAKKLVAALEESDSDDLEAPMVYEASASYWLEELKNELVEMAFITKVKLAEWKSWLAL